MVPIMVFFIQNIDSQADILTVTERNLINK